MLKNFTACYTKFEENYIMGQLLDEELLKNPVSRKDFL